MSADLYTWFLALCALAVAGAIGWATIWQLKRPISSPEAKLSKRRMLVSAVSLGILLVMSGITQVIIGHQVSHGNAGDALAVGLLAIVINIFPRLIAFCGCAYCISTYPFVKAFFAKLSIVAIIIGIFIGFIPMLLIFVNLYALTILLAFIIWLLSFLNLLGIKPGDSLASAIHGLATKASSHAGGGDGDSSGTTTITIHGGSRTGCGVVLAISLWGDRGGREWPPSQAPAEIGCEVYKDLCSDAASVPPSVYCLVATGSGAGTVWRLCPAAEAHVTILINNAPISAPVILQPGDRISLLPAGSTDVAAAFARIIAKTRLLAETH